MRIRAILAAAVLALAAIAAPAVSAQTAAKGTLVGRVVDGHGKSVANARVVASGAADVEATTDAKGQFRFELDPGEYRLAFEAEGYASASMREPVTVSAGKETKLKKRVELPAADEESVVRGSVFTVEGLSVADAKVTIERVAEEGGKPVSEFKRETVSDSMGLFTFRVPKGGGRFNLTAFHDRYSGATVTIELTGGEILNAPPLKLGPKH